MGSLITHDVRCTNETKFNIACQKKLQQEDNFTRKGYLNLKKKQVKCYKWTLTLYDVKTWTLQKAWKCGVLEVWRRSEGPMG